MSLVVKRRNGRPESGALLFNQVLFIVLRKVLVRYLIILVQRHPWNSWITGSHLKRRGAGGYALGLWLLGRVWGHIWQLRGQPWQCHVDSILFTTLPAIKFKGSLNVSNRWRGSMVQGIRDDVIPQLLLSLGYRIRWQRRPSLTQINHITFC